MFKKNFNCALWLGILNLPLACFFGLSYIPQGETPWFVLCTFFFALIGQLFVYFAISSVIFILPAFNWHKKLGWPSLIYATLVLSICHLLLNIDAYLFEGYNQHLVSFFQELNNRGVDWESVNWMHWGIQIVIILGYSGIMLAVARFLSNHRSLYWPFALLVIIMYLLSSGIFMFAHSRNVQPLVDLEEINLPKFINIGQIVAKFNSAQNSNDEVTPKNTQVDPSNSENIGATYGSDDSDYSGVQGNGIVDSLSQRDLIEEAQNNQAEGQTAPEAAEQGETGNADKSSEQNQNDPSVVEGQEPAANNSGGMINSFADDSKDTSGLLNSTTQQPRARGGATTIEPAQDPREFNPFNN